jgi:hypothetical protein
LTRAVDGGHADTVHLLLGSKDVDMAALRVGEIGFWESLHEYKLTVIPQEKHMSLPNDLRFRLGIRDGN